MVNAKISGTFILNGSHLKGDDGLALIANGLTATGDLRCAGGFPAEGGITLPRAASGDSLVRSGAHLDGKGEAAVTASHLKVGSDMLGSETTAKSGINLMASTIGGLLGFHGSHLDGKNGPGVSIISAEIEAYATLRWL